MSTYDELMDKINRKRQRERASDRAVAQAEEISIEEFDADTTAPDTVSDATVEVPINLFQMMVDGIQSWLDGEAPPPASYYVNDPLWEQPLDEAKAILSHALQEQEDHEEYLREQFLGLGRASQIQQLETLDNFSGEAQ